MSGDVQLADVVAVACAEAFRGDGEIFASGMGVMPMLGARLARATFSPDLLVSDGEAFFVDGDLPVGASVAATDDAGIEGWIPFRSVFDLLWGGRRHVMMGASQMDMFGNSNIANIGPWDRPTSQLLGVRGGPGNTINHATSYWVGNHSSRVFCDHVDVVSGIGWNKVDPANPAYRFVNVFRVVSNLGVFDFGGPDHSMRALSLHPGVESDEVRENTGFEVAGLSDAQHTRLPSAEELTLIRERIDPKSLRDKEVKI
jgi:acyl CoA:acetate/3-ketoacid CoA transferase beta subunit